MRLTLKQAAEAYPCTKSTLCKALNKGLLAGKMENGRWIIDMKDLSSYKEERYKRNRSPHRKNNIFENRKDIFSLYQIADLLNCTISKIYYAVYSGKLKAHKIGSYWIVQSEDVEDYKNRIGNKKNGFRTHSDHQRR